MTLEGRLGDVTDTFGWMEGSMETEEARAAATYCVPSHVPLWRLSYSSHASAASDTRPST